MKIELDELNFVRQSVNYTSLKEEPQMNTLNSGVKTLNISSRTLSVAQIVSLNPAIVKILPQLFGRLNADLTDDKSRS